MSAIWLIVHYTWHDPTIQGLLVMVLASVGLALVAYEHDNEGG